jgi:hypothetical protein
MLRKRFRRHLGFESLESMLLLSGGLAAEHPGVPVLVAKAAKVKGPITLTGSAIGTYRLGHAFGTPVNFSAVGQIKPLGHLTLKGSLLLGIKDPTGRMTMSTAHGKVFATLNASSAGEVFTYTITGGTGKWAKESGTGEALVLTVPSKAKGSSHGRFSVTFLNLTLV